MRSILIFALLWFVCGNCGAVVLIDQNTRNGSFETGQWNPWDFSDNVLVHDVTFASDGSYYAELQTTTGRESIFQRDFSIDKNAGSAFMFQIDVRNGTNPFDELDVSVYGWTYSGQFIYTLPGNRFDIPAEAADTWVTITDTRTFNPSDWQELDVRTLYFSIQFSKNNWVQGELLQGFLDNITLTQIPEPATVLLLGIGATLLRKKRT